jgi:pimeloyl-ACP methyl ester carboxylesterase
VDAALHKVQASWQALPADQPASDAQTTHYRLALDGLLHALQRHAAPQTWTGTHSAGSWSITFAGDPRGLNSVPPSWCRSITPVDPDKALRGIRGQRVAGGGAGLPVIMIQPRTEGSGDRFIPLNGRHFPATLTAEFTAPRKVTLTFHHSRSVRSTEIRGLARPLAYDVSAALSEAMAPRFFRKYAFRGLMRPGRDLAVADVYTPEPFDPGKIPVVLVHGIDSAPHIWANVMNEMAADPVLNRRCQVWYFLYPTGLSIPSAAASLRSSLTEARDFYDPQHRHAAIGRMVLAGHSMGGLLSKMQMMDSGEDLHYAFWTRPLEKLPLRAETKAMVARTLHFRRLPFVTRAVFIATPHRGSEVTDISVIRLFFRLVRPDRVLTGFLREMASAARSMIHPGLHRFETFGARSNEGLSPHHPMLEALNRRPLLAPYDNLIAVFPPMSFGKPLEQSTDGVVPWNSAWLAGAESTASFNAFHTCIGDPELAEELMQILRRHLQDN